MLTPGQGITWRPRTAKDTTLPTMHNAENVVPSRLRCHAIGLKRGDCEMDRTPGSKYCYYHDKLVTGACEPHIWSVTREVEDFDVATGKRKVRTEAQLEVRTDCYPVWPLPKQGYVVLIPKDELVAA